MKRILGEQWGAWTIAWIVLWLAVALPPARAAEGGYRFAPDPVGAVTEFQVEPEGVATSPSGLKYLVATDRVLLTGRQPIWHRQISYLIAEERGLENAGQFSLAYQPAYQRVEIHAIDVWRDGQRLDRRASSRIDVLRRESELESGILDGSLTINITVPDLRLGDRLAYRYSVVGYNPVFGAGYHDSYLARFGVPVGLRQIGFVYPAAMKLQWRAPQQGFTTGLRDAGDVRILEATAHNLKGVSEEENAPTTYDPYGRVEVSTGSGWADVVAWALPLYPHGFRDRKVATPLIERLKLSRADPMGSALRATAFVQGEIRYTGLDMGENSHAPNPPELTLERRFGDCKDKTTLLIALLSEAGIQADPVLVDTEERAAISQRLPSPLAFNHVIVRARVAGQELWIDPTLERERGDFASRRALAFGRGLPIRAGVDALVALPDPMPAAPQVEVSQTIALRKQEAQASADFQVATEYRQGFAEGVRQGFSSDGVEEMGKSYLNYMQGYYEGLRAKGAPAFEDRETTFKVKEHYKLQWNTVEDGTTFGIVMFQLLDWLPKIADRERLSPLALGGPRHGRQTIRSTLPGGWSIGDEKKVVESPYFRFERTVRTEGNALVIAADWRRLADEVPASAVPQLRKDVAQVRELLQYDVDLDPEFPLFASKPRDWLWPLAVLPLTGLLLGLAWLLRRRVAVAGMLYRPRLTLAGLVQRDGVIVGGLVLLLLSLLLDTVYEVGGRAATGNGLPWLLGMSLGLMFGLAVRWLIWSGLLKAAFRIIGHRLDYVALLATTGWASVPMTLLAVMALLALRFDLSLLGDGADPGAAQWPGLLVALLLLMVGLCWSLIALVNAYASLAGIRRRRSLAVVIVAFLLCVVALLPFAGLYLLTRGVA